MPGSGKRMQLGIAAFVVFLTLASAAGTKAADMKWELPAVSIRILRSMDFIQPRVEGKSLDMNRTEFGIGLGKRFEFSIMGLYGKISGRTNAAHLEAGEKHYRFVPWRSRGWETSLTYITRSTESSPFYFEGLLRGILGVRAKAVEFALKAPGIKGGIVPELYWGRQKGFQRAPTRNRILSSAWGLKFSRPGRKVDLGLSWVMEKTKAKILYGDGFHTLKFSSNQIISFSATYKPPVEGLSLTARFTYAGSGVPAFQTPLSAYGLAIACPYQVGKYSPTGTDTYDFYAKGKNFFEHALGFATIEAAYRRSF